MITAYREDLSIKNSCNLMDISESGFYQKSKKIPDKYIIEAIYAVKNKFFYYGYRRVQKELKRRGFDVNHKKILRIMKEEKLIVKRKRSTPKTTQSNHSLKRYDNLLIGFSPESINEAWVGDITYVPIEEKFAYLALLMDIFSRKIVGWNLTWNPDRHLTLSTLNRAVKERGVENVKNCIHHTDHGSQYLCKDYIQRIKELNMKPSMGEVGNSYDNAFAESLNKTVKYEAVYPAEFDSFNEAYEIIAQHIKSYNKERLHSGISYLPPEEFEKNRRS